MILNDWLLALGLFLILYFSIGGLLFEQAWSRYSAKEVFLKGVLIWPWKVYLEIKESKKGLKNEKVH